MSTSKTMTFTLHGETTFAEAYARAEQVIHNYYGECSHTLDMHVEPDEVWATSYTADGRRVLTRTWECRVDVEVTSAIGHS